LLSFDAVYGRHPLGLRCFRSLFHHWFRLDFVPKPTPLFVREIRNSRRIDIRTPSNNGLEPQGQQDSEEGAVSVHSGILSQGKPSLVAKNVRNRDFLQRYFQAMQMTGSSLPKKVPSYRFFAEDELNPPARIEISLGFLCLSLSLNFTWELTS